MTEQAKSSASPRGFTVFQPTFHISTRRLWPGLLFCCLWPLSVTAGTPLFGYKESLQTDLGLFRQWLRVMERHIIEDTPEGACTERRLNRCHLREWRAFLEGLQGLPQAEQLQRVNRFANRRTYVLDIDNYGVPDYWAIVREFLDNGGDCEDYAITKLFSLRWLGYPPERLRIVVLQDTNLRIPHAVLAVYSGDDIFILDNQIEAVVDHRQIVHYVPVYSINEQHWWIHAPAS